MDDELKTILIILIALVGVWFLSGGYTRSKERDTAFVGLSNPEGDVEQLNLIPGPYRRPASSTSESDNDGSNSNENNGTTTPYNGRVSLKKGKANQSDPNKEYLEIDLSGSAKSDLNLTGWKIRSIISGKEVVIPKSAIIPYSSRVNDTYSVVLQPGNSLFVVSGGSPVGFSFRTNICTGYLEQSNNFSPSLKKQCPLPEDDAEIVEFPSRFNDQCLAFLSDLNRCEINTAPLLGTYGPECNRIVSSRLNYNGCVDTYRNEEDFLQDEWYVFLDQPREIWRDSREKIQLIDHYGTIVDEIEY